jgi:hypothetical protein
MRIFLSWWNGGTFRNPNEVLCTPSPKLCFKFTCEVFLVVRFPLPATHCCWRSCCYCTAWIPCDKQVTVVSGMRGSDSLFSTSVLLLLFTAIGFSPGGSSPYASTHNTNVHIIYIKITIQNKLHTIKKQNTYSKYKYIH